MANYANIKGECARCGFIHPLSRLRKEWTGLKVCPPCWDPKPADLSPPRIKPEGVPVPGAAPQTTPIERPEGEFGGEDL